MVRSRTGTRKVPTLWSLCCKVMLPEKVPGCVGVRVI